MKISPEPRFNFEIAFAPGDIVLNANIKRTILNRFRYWMPCKFFPFKIKRWD